MTKRKIEQNTGDKIFIFKTKSDRRKLTIRNKIEEDHKPKIEPVVEKNNTVLYDYFKENNEEILHLESICFSLSDILFILDLIDRRKKIFEGLPDFNKFEQYYKKIVIDKNVLMRMDNKDAKMKYFFIVFKDEKNEKLQHLLRSDKNSISTLNTNNQDSELICKKIKLCIKTILKGLNLLNNKDYSYLNKAISTNKFFSEIKHTLNDISE